jgi:AraC family transcriptional regulator
MMQHGTRDPATALATAAMASRISHSGPATPLARAASGERRPCAGAATRPISEVARGLNVVHHGGLPKGKELRYARDDAHVVLMALKPAWLTDAASRRNDIHALNIGSFLLLPAGSNSRWIISQRPTQILELAVSAERLARIAHNGDDERPAAVPLPMMIGQQDVVIESIGRACLFELLSPTRGTQMLLESYGIGLAVHLLRKYGEQQVEGVRDECAMSPFRLKRVLDFIEHNLEENLTMRDLAEEAGLSLYHFTRCFKQDTGYTPYRYIIERRIAKAKELISSSDMPLAQVALASGFGSQANFTSMFHRLVGMPPGVWRKANGW